MSVVQKSELAVKNTAKINTYTITLYLAFFFSALIAPTVTIVINMANTTSIILVSIDIIEII
ncbi:TPA: hypothetical protein DCP18_00365 [Candidatus Wolfebacteria bacterium]|nr:hypothetical protein [Candidatus Wolfebacteria bacterium]